MFPVFEHEFARTATAHLKIEYNQDVTRRFKAGAWAVFEAEIKGNLSKTIGMEFGEQISRKVTLKFEAAAGKLVLYRVLWKQNTRKGKLSMAFGEKLIQIPYSITFGLHHSVESKDTQNIKQI